MSLGSVSRSSVLSVENLILVLRLQMATKSRHTNILLTNNVDKSRVININISSENISNVIYEMKIRVESVIHLELEAHVELNDQIIQPEPQTETLNDIHVHVSLNPCEVITSDRPKGYIDISPILERDDLTTITCISSI